MPVVDPRSPLTAAELRRIGQALRPECCPLSGSVFVVISRFPPLHRVLGVVASREEGQQLIEHRDRWVIELTADEAAHLTVVGPYQAAEPSGFEILPRPHMFPCEWFPPGPPGGHGHPIDWEALPSITEVSRVRVTLYYGERSDHQVEFTINGPIDALFLTRGAADLFLFPAYQAAYGDEYVAAMRERMGT